MAIKKLVVAAWLVARAGSYVANPALQRTLLPRPSQQTAPRPVDLTQSSRLSCQLFANTQGPTAETKRTGVSARAEGVVAGLSAAARVLSVASLGFGLPVEWPLAIATSTGLLGVGRHERKARDKVELVAGYALLCLLPFQSVGSAVLSAVAAFLGLERRIGRRVARRLDDSRRREVQHTDAVPTLATEPPVVAEPPPAQESHVERRWRAVRASTVVAPTVEVLPNAKLPNAKPQTLTPEMPAQDLTAADDSLAKKKDDLPEAADSSERAHVPAAAEETTKPTVDDDDVEAVASLERAWDELLTAAAETTAEEEQPAAESVSAAEPLAAEPAVVEPTEAVVDSEVEAVERSPLTVEPISPYRVRAKTDNAERKPHDVVQAAPDTLPAEEERPVVVTPTEPEVVTVASTNAKEWVGAWTVVSSAEENVGDVLVLQDGGLAKATRSFATEASWRKAAGGVEVDLTLARSLPTGAFGGFRPAKLVADVTKTRQTGGKKAPHNETMTMSGTIRQPFFGADAYSDITLQKLSTTAVPTPTATSSQ